MIHFLVQYQYQYHWYILIQYTSGVSISLNHWYMTVIHLRRTTKKTAVANSSSRVSATVSRIQIPMLPGDKLWSWRRFLWLRHDTINWRSNQCCWQPDTRKCINYMSDTQTLELKMLARYSQSGKFSSNSSQLHNRLAAPVDKTVHHGWPEQSATPQPSKWLDVWESYSTESKPQFVLELKASTDITICVST